MGIVGDKNMENNELMPYKYVHNNGFHSHQLGREITIDHKYTIHELYIQPLWSSQSHNSQTLQPLNRFYNTTLKMTHIYHLTSRHSFNVVKKQASKPCLSHYIHNFLYYASSFRKSNDIIYSTHISRRISNIEAYCAIYVMSKLSFLIHHCQVSIVNVLIEGMQCKTLSSKFLLTKLF